MITRELDRPSHPIIVFEMDICDVVKANKLNTLKLIQLRAVCKELGLEVTGHQNRKYTFSTAIQTFVEGC